MNLIPFALALSAAFLWGLAQSVGKVCMRDLNTITFNAIRFSSIAIVLTPLLLITGTGLVSNWSVFLAIISGVVALFFATGLYFYCMKRAPAYSTITIANSSPIWAVLMATLLLGEVITPIIILSLALVVWGAYLLVPKNKENNKYGLAVPLTMFVSVVWGLNQVIRKSGVDAGMEVMPFLWVSVIFAAVLFNLTAGLSNSWKNQHLSKTVLGLSVFSGLTGQLIGNFLYISALEFEGVSNLAPFISATIPFGFLMSVLIVGERPSKKSVIGMFIVFLGVALAAL